MAFAHVAFRSRCAQSVAANRAEGKLYRDPNDSGLSHKWSRCVRDPREKDQYDSMHETVFSFKPQGCIPFDHLIPAPEGSG